MTLEQSATPTFANHQTFHPRFGWIKKGFDAAVTDPDIFNAPSAPVELGVGKNMVEAIRFWCMATKVISRRPHPQRPRLSVYTPTRFGYALLDESVGLDPYMEDPSTLWILHWQAISAQTILPVWRLAFNDFSVLEFAEEELLQYCVDEISATTWQQPKLSSIQKDVDCLLRMYTRRDTRGRQTLDDMLDSPFRELQIIQPSPGQRNSFRFRRGAKRGLPAAAITYSCLDFLSRDGQSNRTVSVTRLAVDPGSPGRILKLTEQDIVDALEESATDVRGLQVARPAGSRQLAVDGDPGLAALAVLWSHHERRRTDLSRIEALDVAGPDAMKPRLSDDAIQHSVRANASRRESAANTQGSAA